MFLLNISVLKTNIIDFSDNDDQYCSNCNNCADDKNSNSNSNLIMKIIYLLNNYLFVLDKF